MTEPELDFDLADAVEAVRDQLLAAVARAAGKDVKFEVGPISLEFAVELRRGAGVKAGIRAWVLSGEASASASSQRTHKVSVVLTPVDARTSGRIMVGDEKSGSTALFGSKG